MELQLDLLMQAMAALGIGLLIGLEREYSQRKIRGRPKQSEAAGIRTFALVALTGNLLTWLPESLMLWAVALGFVFTAMIALISYQRTSAGKEADKGTTSEIVIVVTYLLGCLTGFGYLLPATIVAVVVFALLHFKQVLHHFSHSLSKDDIRQTVQFLVVAVVVLPVLPNQSFGPYESLNPQHIWMMIVLISGLGFASYASIKLIGERAGLGVTGILGGLTSSTAVTLAMSRLSSSNPKLQTSCTLATILACSTMFPRTLALTTLFNIEVTLKLLLPVATILLISAVTVYLLWKKSTGMKLDPVYEPTTNPLSFKTALAFGLFYAVVIFFVHMAQANFGDAGLMTVAGLSGLSDIDPVTLSLSEISGTTLTATLAAKGILLAAAANSLVKLILGLSFSPSSARIWLLAGLLPMVLLSALFITLL